MTYSTKELTSFTGVKRKVFTSTINGATITAGTVERLEELVKNHKPLNNDGARFDYNNNTNFNND